MIKNIFNTFFTKTLTAAINLVTVILLSQVLGAEGKGVSSIIITSVSFLLVFSNLFAGTTIVYFIPRISNPALVWLGYLWTFFTCVFGYIVLKITHLAPNDYIIHITIIAGIQSLLVVHSKWLLGKEQLVKGNYITIVQSSSMLIGISVLFFLKEKSIYSYISALYISFGIAYLISVLETKKYWAKPDFRELISRIKEVFIYGIYNQADNVLFLFTLRANYYLLEYFHGSATLGIYSNGVALAEAVWLVTYSVSLVLYARLVNIDDVAYAQNITWKLAKITLYLSALGIGIASLLPSSFYTYLFGNEFNDVPKILMIYAPGVSVFSCALVIIHYFAGIGRFKLNAVFSLVGFVLVLVLSYLLIPKLGYIGAAISASTAYFTIGIIVLIVFFKESKIKMNQFLINQEDYRFLKLTFFSKKQTGI